MIAKRNCSQRSLGVVAAVAFLLLCASTAAGDVAIDLEYTAAATCPTREGLVAKVRERVWFELGGREARRFVVVIAAAESGFEATLAVGDDTERKLAASICDDLVTAVALVIALAIDPSALSSPAVAPRPPSEATPPATDKRDNVVVRAPSQRRPFTLAGGLGVGVGITPDALVVPRLGAARGWGMLEYELVALAGRDTTFGAGRASFVWVAARASACWRTRIRLAPALCSHVETGLVHASGSDIVNGRGVTRGWIAPGAHAELRKQLSAHSFVALEVGGSVPLVRDRYSFLPSMVVHETAPVTGSFAVFGGVLFE